MKWLFQSKASDFTHFLFGIYSSGELEAGCETAYYGT